MSEQDSAVEMNKADQREYERFDERNRVTVTVISAPDIPTIESRSYHCWTKDLSAGGLRFCVHSRVPVGAILKLEVIFDNPREVFRHIGTVMWEQEFDNGNIKSNWLGVKITETIGGANRFAIWKVRVENIALR